MKVARGTLRTLSSRPRLEALRQQLDAEAPAPSKALKARKPSWPRAGAAVVETYERLRSTVRKLKLATVCEEARCPNIGECWGGTDGTATATIMIMGDTCTRVRADGARRAAFLLLSPLDRARDARSPPSRERAGLPLLRSQDEPVRAAHARDPPLDAA